MSPLGAAALSMGDHIAWLRVMLPPDLNYLWLPFLACILVAAMHSYLGLHVIERGVIFVDLALAQIAAFGATVALLAGYAANGTVAYASALGFSFLGAAIFSATRVRHGQVSQEAIIGVVYAVASAAAIVAVSAAQDPHGAEHIKDLLAGSVILVRPEDIRSMAAIYLGVAVFHLLCRKPFFAISLDADAAFADGVRVRLWDFLFYASFAFVITTSVQVVGVLLAFAYLIVPAILAMLVCQRFRHRWLFGWLVASAVSFLGLVLSYTLPAGPVLVCLFGVVLGGAGIVSHVVRAQRPWLACAQIAVFTGLGVGALVLLSLLSPGAHEHDHDHASRVSKGGESVRQEPYANPEDVLAFEVEVDGLSTAKTPEAMARLEHIWHTTRSEKLQIKVAEVLVGLGSKEGLAHMVELMRSAQTPGTRMRALAVLEPLAGSDLGYDIEPSEDAIRRWETWWAENAGRMRWLPTQKRFELED